MQRLTVMQKAIRLLETDLFRDVASEQVAGIAATTGEMLFDAGEQLELDDDACGFHVVVEGEIEIRVGGRVARRATPGMELGLLPLLGIEPKAEFVAGAPTHTIVLSPAEFRRAISDSPDFAMGVIRGLARGIQALSERLADEEGRG